MWWEAIPGNGHTFLKLYSTENLTIIAGENGVSLRFQVSIQPVNMSNATDSSRESNPSGRICILCAAPLCHVADCFVITWLFVCSSCCCIVGLLFDQKTRNEQKDNHLSANSPLLQAPPWYYISNPHFFGLRPKIWPTTQKSSPSLQYNKVPLKLINKVPINWLNEMRWKYN